MQNKNTIREIKKLNELKNKINELINKIITTNINSKNKVTNQISKLYIQLIDTYYEIERKIKENKKIYINIKTIDELLEIL